MTGLHIALVCEERLPPIRYGGTSRVVWSLALALRRAGHRVTLVAPAGSERAVFPLVPWTPERPLDQLVPEDVDLIHAHIPLRQAPERPYLCTIHGNGKAGEVFLPNTNFLTADHARRHAADVYVHNGLDFSDWPPPGAPAAIERRLVFLARASRREKNLRGAKRIARRAGMPLDVLGGYGLPIPGRIRYHGMVDDARKQRVLRGAAGLLFPVTWHEPFGLALIEAMYFGVPVFGTPYGSLPELVPRSCGHLSADSRELAAAAQRAGDWDREEIHRWTRERFNADRMAADYLELYGRILAGHCLHDTPPRALQAPETRLPFR